MASKVNRRREIIGIAERLFAEVEYLRVDTRFSCHAEMDEVLAEAPDIVVIATGGIPNTEILRTGADLVTSTWEVLSGEVPRYQLFPRGGRGRQPPYSRSHPRFVAPV